MKTAARARLFLARHPWVYWVAVVALAGGVAAGVHRQLAQVDDERERWSIVLPVAVAMHDHRPGDVLATRIVDLPRAAIPPTAIGELPAGVRARQRVSSGEIVVEADITATAGPAAGAEPGTIVVPVVDSLARDVRIGLAVQIVAEGIVVAAEATVVQVVDEVVFVAVAPADAPLVADAAKRNDAALLFVP